MCVSFALKMQMQMIQGNVYWIFFVAVGIFTRSYLHERRIQLNYFEQRNMWENAFLPFYVLRINMYSPSCMLQDDTKRFWRGSFALKE